MYPGLYYFITDHASIRNINLILIIWYVLMVVPPCKKLIQTKIGMQCLITISTMDTYTIFHVPSWAFIWVYLVHLPTWRHNHHYIVAWRIKILFFFVICCKIMQPWIDACAIVDLKLDAYFGVRPIASRIDTVLFHAAKNCCPATFIRDRSIFRTDLQIRTLFGLQLTHPRCTNL